jgi:PAT family beta-lactamase induction signal transducer AmpG|tara:strand:+ start:1548 stop:2885 length:1338 start_codon:yes stop_codon:yes gene_type:complete
VQAWLAAASVYRDRRLLALLFLGFSSGLPLALTFSTLTVWLAESGVQKGTIGLFAALGTPYALKFLWAPLMDRAPLPGLTRLLGRRRGWMLGCQVALMAGILALGAQDPIANPGLTALLALSVAFFSASQDIVIDAYRVEILDERQYAAGAAAVVFGYRVAMLVSGAGALYLAALSDWFAAYGAMAGLMVVGMVTVLLSAEPQRQDSAETRQRQTEIEAFLAARGIGGDWRGRAAAWLYIAVVSPFLEFVSSRGWLVALVLGFVVFYKLGDSLAGVMTNPFLIELGFSKIDIANVSKLYGFTATITGLALGGWLLGAAGMIRSLWICGILQLASNLMFAVQAEVGASLGFLALTIGVENLAGGMGTAVFVAYLSSLCNVAYTATQYALLSSLFALPRTLISAGSGYVAEALAWTDFFIFTAVGAVPGLVILWWLTRPGSAVRPAS